MPKFMVDQYVLVAGTWGIIEDDDPAGYWVIFPNTEDSQFFFSFQLSSPAGGPPADDPVNKIG